MLRVPARNAPGVIRLPIVTAAVLAALSCADEGTRPDPGSPTRLTFLLQPSDASAGAALGPVEVAFEDDDGNLVSSASATVTLALTPVGATLNGTTSVLASSGTATFTDLAVENAGNGYTLTATAPGVTGATSTAFDVAPGPAAALEVVVQPTTATAGAAISPGIQLAVRDEFGNIAATGSTSVTLALTPGTGAPGATLGGTTTRSAVNGLATFGDLTIDKPGMAYSLSATATGLPGATTDAFDITAGQAARLVFMDQPSDAVAGAMMAPLIRVALQDAAGNAVAGSAASVTIGVTGGTGASGATLNGTRTRAAVDGIATFDDLSLDKASDGYTLTASSGSLTSAISEPFRIAAAAPARLAFIVQPSGAAVGGTISPAPQVGVHDEFGNAVSSATTGVTLAITSGTGTPGAQLTGTTTRSAVAGVATFDGVTITAAGSGYTLTASASGLTSTTSSSFSVSAAVVGCANPQPGWLFCDDFETDRLDSYFEYTSDGNRFTRVNGVGQNGSYGMRAQFGAGTVSAGSLKLAFGRTPDAYMTPVDDGTQNHREIHWRFYFRNQSGWTGGGGDKLSRITVFATQNWAQAMIGHVWSGSGSDADYLTLDPASGTDLAGNLTTTTYNDFANLRFLGIARSATPLFDPQRVGQWYCIETRVKLNTAGQSDGLFELRVNGVLEASKTGLNWLGSYSAYGLNAIFLENYWNAGSPVAQERYFDDFVVSTTPIGCS